MSESLKKKIRDIARRLAEEELHKHSKGGIVAFGEGEARHHRIRHHKGRGEGLIDTYGLDVVEGGKRRVGRPRKHHHGMGEGEGEKMRMHHRSRSMSVGRAEGERMSRMHHRKSRAGLIAYGEGERIRHRSMSRGHALIDSYGLETLEGGRRTYHKMGKEYVKRTRAPSAYNMFVKKYILGHKGATISEAAHEWRNRK
jgi:hypothetical protein